MSGDPAAREALDKHQDNQQKLLLQYSVRQ